MRQAINEARYSHDKLWYRGVRKVAPVAASSCQVLLLLLSVVIIKTEAFNIRVQPVYITSKLSVT
jgi:hypothetical protein